MPIRQYRSAVPRAQGILILGSGVGGSVSSGTAETALAQITIPAGMMGATGSVRVTTLWSYTNSGNNKTLRVRFGGASGTQYASQTVTTTVAAYLQLWIRNSNATNAQKSFNASSGLFSAGSASALVTGAIDTTAAVIIYISGQTASSGETITLEGYTVELIPGV